MAARSERARSAETRPCPNEIVAALRAGRVLFTRADAVEHHVDRSALVAVHAHVLANRAVNLDDPFRVTTGRMVESVHILGDQGVQLPAALEFEEGAVAPVGFSLVGECGQLRLPGALSDVGFGQIVLDRGHLLGLWILGPDALGTAEVGNPRIRGDPGAGQHDDAGGFVDPVAGILHDRLRIAHLPIL